MSRANELRAATGICSYCPTLCMHACPVSTAEGSDAVTPWAKMSLVRWVTSGTVPMDADVAQVFQACTSCQACQDACKHEIDVAGTLRSARTWAISEGFDTWSEGVESPASSPDEQGVWPAGASGVWLYEAGLADRFRTFALAASSRWNRESRVVFTSAEDVRCVREVYPSLGITMRCEVRLASELVQRPATVPGVVAYHEACHIARGDQHTADAVRAAAQSVAGGELVELRWVGKEATCCGGGGVYARAYPDGAKLAARRVLESALTKGATRLLTGCGGCARHLSDAAEGIAIDVQVIR